MANLLSRESSPYLLQHADNPVHWYPWGDEAFAAAVDQEKPILLSIGYAACHWCHVMAHESFEDAATAEFMNRHFINVKVDREERPDIDAIYMEAVVALTGQGGWPMTVILTPQGKPFFGGTYFPPSPRYGMPSFLQVLDSVARAWSSRRDQIVDSAQKITAHLQNETQAPSELPVTDELLSRAVGGIQKSYDPQNGGFGRAPKFPQPMILEFLLRHAGQAGNQQVMDMVHGTLEAMARGGIYDHLGGGFARYSTDEVWLVPHFEKMLYDNALLSRIYLHAWHATGREHYRQVVVETLNWALTEMRDGSGGFYSSIDADSEGEEGKYYVWQKDEISEILGPDAALFSTFYDVTDRGNWEGKNILRQRVSMQELADNHAKTIEEVREVLGVAEATLLRQRDKRIRPATDDKILTSWNGLMLASLAEAGRDLDEPRFLKAALELAHFLLHTMRNTDGRLWRTWKAGHDPKVNAFLEDYAYLAEGLIVLYQSTFDEKWLLWAQELAEIMISFFADQTGFGFFDTSLDHEALIRRPKDLQDNAIPSANSVACLVLMQLSLFTGQGHYRDVVEKSIRSMAPLMVRHPTAFAQWLVAADFMVADPLEVAIAGDPDGNDALALISAVFERFRPHLVVAAGASDTSQIPLLQNRTKMDGVAAAYVCKHFVCQRPVTSAQELTRQLDGQRTP